MASVRLKLAQGSRVRLSIGDEQGYPSAPLAELAWRGSSQ